MWFLMKTRLKDESFAPILMITNMLWKPFVDNIFKQYKSFAWYRWFYGRDTDLSAYSHIVLWLNWDSLYPNLFALEVQEGVELKEEYQNIERFTSMVYDKLEQFSNDVICVNFESVTYMPVSFHTNKYQVNKIIRW